MQNPQQAATRGGQAACTPGARCTGGPLLLAHSRLTCQNMASVRCSRCRLPHATVNRRHSPTSRGAASPRSAALKALAVSGSSSRPRDRASAAGSATSARPANNHSTWRQHRTRQVEAAKSATGGTKMIITYRLGPCVDRALASTRAADAGICNGAVHHYAARTTCQLWWHWKHAHNVCVQPKEGQPGRCIGVCRQPLPRHLTCCSQPLISLWSSSTSTYCCALPAVTAS
jgi:hypothetical protein